MYRVKADYVDHYAGKARVHCTVYSEEFETADECEDVMGFLYESLDERMADWTIDAVIQHKLEDGTWREVIEVC